MVEGWLRGIEQKRKGDKLSFHLYLKKEDGKLEIIEDPRPYEFTFWVDTFLNLQELLKNQKFEHLTLSDIVIESGVKKYYGGEKKDLVQVTVKNPRHKSELVNYFRRLKSMKGGVKGIIGADRSLNEDYRIQKGLSYNDYVLVKDSKLEKIVRAAPKPKSAAVDLEVYNFNKERGRPYFPSPNDSRNPAPEPIICFSYASDSQKIVITHTHTSAQPFVCSLADEAELIRRSLEIIEKEAPDFIYTFNGDNFDWPYWKIRAEKNGISFAFRGDEVKKKRGGLSYVYKIPGTSEMDFMQILRKSSERTPGRGLKDISAAVLLKDPMEVKGQDVYEYWDNDDRRPEFFEYSLKDVEDLKKIIDGQSIDRAIEEACNFLGLFPEELRKTGDEICNFFVKKLHKDAIALEKTAFGSRDYAKERSKFSFGSAPGLYISDDAAGLLNLDLLHPHVLYELLKKEEQTAREFKIDFGKYEILSSSLEQLLSQCVWAQAEFDKTGKPEYKTLRKLLGSIAKEFSSLIISERYDWHNKTLSDKFVDALENKIIELVGNDLLYADWDNIFVRSSALATILDNSKSKFGNLLAVEHQSSSIVDALIIGDAYIYLNRHNNLLYHKGITVKKKKEGKLINALVEGFYRALFKGGKTAVKDYLMDAGQRLTKQKLSKENLLKIGSITKPETHYVVDTDDVLASKLYDAEPFEQFEYGVSNGEVVKAEDYEPVPSDAIALFTEKIEKSLEAIKLDKMEIETEIKRGMALGYNQTTLEAF